MAKIGDDCFYFYNQTCIKGAACPFRHVEEAKPSTVTCENWLAHRCFVQSCPFRHTELQQSTPCYYESQPGGCTRPDCQFRHKFPRQPTVPVPIVSTSAGPNAVPVTSMPQPTQGPGPQIGIRPQWHRPPVRPPWPGQRVPPPGHMFPGPPVPRPVRPGAPGFPPFHHTGPVPARIAMMPIEPVIINPNEESDQDSIKGSPMKHPPRQVEPSATTAPTSVQSSNPLDYFLNAKPWVDPTRRNVLSKPQSPPRTVYKQGSVSPRRSLSPRRSPSPRRRSQSPRRRSQSPRRRSQSPRRRSQSPRRRSPSPLLEGRRRSVSVERFNSGPRRRSGSLDRSRSPEWRDRRRFVRRSPPRRRSRSPDRRGGVGILGRFRTANRSNKLEEVKVTGSKVISIKKDKKDEQEEQKDKQEEKPESKVVVKEQSKATPVVEEEVKSLEDIYRERALQSLMEAKRKKILENKRKRWENVDSGRKSESEKSDKSDKQSAGEDENQSAVDEKGDNQEEMDSSSDSPDDDDGGGTKTDDDLPDDIDIELGEGDIESDREASDRAESDSDNDDKSHHSDEEPTEKLDKKKKSSVSIPVKPSIKSRLGLRAVEKSSREKDQDRSESKTNKRSVKDRLGTKPGVESDKPLRSGVIKLNRKSKVEDVLSRIGVRGNVRDRNRDGKNILMLPQITIKNPVDIEDRKAGLKQRLGHLFEEENDSDSKKDRRKKKGIDEELMKILEEEEADIEIEDLELLSKKEKKKLLKKLLTQQGREDEYEALRKKKKRGFKKKKEHVDEEGDRGSKRRINIQGRLGRKEEAEEVDDDLDDDNLPSEDDIELQEAETEAIDEDTEKIEQEEEESPDKNIESRHDDIPVKSFEEIQREKQAKEARLREALEPKSLEDIRRERAVKRTITGEGAGSRITIGQNRRKIVIDEPEPKPADPPVRVTFSGSDSFPKRKLIRLGNAREQNENDQPSEAKMARTARRERQIYIPPTIKKEEPAVSQRVAGPPKGREIVDYGDMFPKKSTSVDDAVKKTTIKVLSSTSDTSLTTRPKLKLQRGPPKVEVKDATVKTFAEIMAEKKRKRLLAQQGKPYTPLDIKETDVTSSQENTSDSFEGRLSPVVTESQVTTETTTSISSSTKVPTLTRTASNSSLKAENKPARWKRRKVNTPELPSSTESPSIQPIISSENRTRPTKTDTKVTNTKEKEVVKTVDDFATQSGVNVQKSASQYAVKREPSVEESKPPVEKKKMSDSFMEFDDELLDMDTDIDLELDTGPQDADELMREIDELLS